MKQRSAGIDERGLLGHDTRRPEGARAGRKTASPQHSDGYKPQSVPNVLAMIRGKTNWSEAQIETEGVKGKSRKVTFSDGLQVRLVTDLERSLAWYREVLGCEVDYWGHAIRGGMKLILQQAKDREDVRTNRASAQRDNYPTDWTGPELAWDTFVHVDYDEFDDLLAELCEHGADIVLGPIQKTHSNGMTFKNVYIRDPDGYIIVFG